MCIHLRKRKDLSIYSKDMCIYLREDMHISSTPPQPSIDSVVGQDIRPLRALAPPSPPTLTILNYRQRLALIDEER